jgi:hypothetical protein
MAEQPQQFFFKCPHCATETSESQVAAQLHDEIFFMEAGRRQARRQTPHAGPGRPTVVRCPGCDSEMGAAELRDHRVPCVRDRLTKLQRNCFKIRLLPKDPDPYPNFSILRIEEESVQFQKDSSMQSLSVELRKIGDITVSSNEQLIYIRLLGRVHWDEPATLWRFLPSRIGRPSREC